MQLDTPWSRKTGDYEVYVSRLQYGNPEAVIDLAEEGGLRLRRVTLDDCDRLIRAAAAARQEILAAQAEAAAPHGTEHVYHGTCQMCGKPEGDGLHAEMTGGAPAADDTDVLDWCPASTFIEYDNVTLYCDRKAGHPGSHHAPGPDEGSEVAWSDEPVSAPKCLGKYDRLGSTDYCQRDEGHDGQHEGHMGRRWNAEAKPLTISDRTIEQACILSRPGYTIDDDRAVNNGTAVSYRLACGCVIKASSGWTAGYKAHCAEHGATVISGFETASVAS